MISMLERYRIPIWIAWPAAVVVVPYMIVRAVAHVRGWGFYWAWDWDVRRTATTVSAILVPLLFMEAMIRTGRNAG